MFIVSEFVCYFRTIKLKKLKFMEFLKKEKILINKEEISSVIIIIILIHYV